MLEVFRRTMPHLSICTMEERLDKIPMIFAGIGMGASGIMKTARTSEKGPHTC